MFEFFKDYIQIIFSLGLHLKLCLCPAKLWSNADFDSQNYGAMQTQPREITEPSYFAPQCQCQRQCRLCPTKSLRNSFRGTKYHNNYLKTIISFLLSNFLKRKVILEIFKTTGSPFQRKKTFCVTVPLNTISALKNFPNSDLGHCTGVQYNYVAV